MPPRFNLSGLIKTLAEVRPKELGKVDPRPLPPVEDAGGAASQMPKTGHASMPVGYAPVKPRVDNIPGIPAYETLRGTRSLAVPQGKENLETPASEMQRTMVKSIGDQLSPYPEAHLTSAELPSNMDVSTPHNVPFRRERDVFDVGRDSSEANPTLEYNPFGPAGRLEPMVDLNDDIRYASAAEAWGETRPEETDLAKLSPLGYPMTPPPGIPNTGWYKPSSYWDNEITQREARRLNKLVTKEGVSLQRLGDILVEMAADTGYMRPMMEYQAKLLRDRIYELRDPAGVMQTMAKIIKTRQGYSGVFMPRENLLHINTLTPDVGSSPLSTAMHEMSHAITLHHFILSQRLNPENFVTGGHVHSTAAMGIHDWGGTDVTARELTNLRNYFNQFGELERFAPGRLEGFEGLVRTRKEVIEYLKKFRFLQKRDFSGTEGLSPRDRAIARFLGRSQFSQLEYQLGSTAEFIAYAPTEGAFQTLLSLIPMKNKGAHMSGNNAMSETLRNMLKAMGMTDFDNALATALWHQELLCRPYDKMNPGLQNWAVTHNLNRISDLWPALGDKIASKIYEMTFDTGQYKPKDYLSHLNELARLWHNYGGKTFLAEVHGMAHEAVAAYWTDKYLRTGQMPTVEDIRMRTPTLDVAAAPEHKMLSFGDNIGNSELSRHMDRTKYGGTMGTRRPHTSSEVLHGIIKHFKSRKARSSLAREYVDRNTLSGPTWEQVIDNKGNIEIGKLVDPDLILKTVLRQRREAVVDNPGWYGLGNILEQHLRLGGPTQHVGEATLPGVFNRYFGADAEFAYRLWTSIVDKKVGPSEAYRGGTTEAAKSTYDTKAVVDEFRKAYADWKFGEKNDHVDAQLKSHIKELDMDTASAYPRRRSRAEDYAISDNEFAAEEGDLVSEMDRRRRGHADSGGSIDRGGVGESEMGKRLEREKGSRGFKKEDPGEWNEDEASYSPAPSGFDAMRLTIRRRLIAAAHAGVMPDELKRFTTYGDGVTKMSPDKIADAVLQELKDNKLSAVEKKALMVFGDASKWSDRPSPKSFAPAPQEVGAGDKYATRRTEQAPLIAALQGSDEAAAHKAFETLIAQHDYVRVIKNRIYKIFHPRGWDDMVDDVYNEAMTAAWNNRMKFDPSKGTSFQTWLYKQANHDAIDAWRKKVAQVKRETGGQKTVSLDQTVSYSEGDPKKLVEPGEIDSALAGLEEGDFGSEPYYPQTPEEIRKQAYDDEPEVLAAMKKGIHPREFFTRKYEKDGVLPAFGGWLLSSAKGKAWLEEFGGLEKGTGAKMNRALESSGVINRIYGLKPDDVFHKSYDISGGDQKFTGITVQLREIPLPSKRQNVERFLASNNDLFASNRTVFTIHKGKGDARPMLSIDLLVPAKHAELARELTSRLEHGDVPIDEIRRMSHNAIEGRPLDTKKTEVWHLNPLDRAMFIMNAFMGKDAGEIAAVVGKDRNSVRDRLAKARKQLRGGSDAI